MRKRFLWTLVCCCIITAPVFVFFGCQQRNRNFHLKIENVATSDIRGIVIEAGDIKIGPMYLGKGTHAEMLSIGDDYRWPTNATIRWKVSSNASTSEVYSVPPFACTSEIPVLVFLFSEQMRWDVLVR